MVGLKRNSRIFENHVLSCVNIPFPSICLSGIEFANGVAFIPKTSSNIISITSSPVSVYCTSTLVQAPYHQLVTVKVCRIEFENLGCFSDTPSQCCRCTLMCLGWGFPYSRFWLCSGNRCLHLYAGDLRYRYPRQGHQLFSLIDICNKLCSISWAKAI